MLQEFLYIWNIFAVMRNQPHLLNPILDRVEDKLKVHQSDLSDESKTLDCYCQLMLLKGMCLRNLGYPLQAQESFMEIIQNEKRISPSSSFLPPHAALELGLILMNTGALQDAKQWLERARRDYTGYLLETIVHFRVHCAMRNLRAATKKKDAAAKLTHSATVPTTFHDIDQGEDARDTISMPDSEDLSTNSDSPQHNNNNLRAKFGKASGFMEMARKMHLLSTSSSPNGRSGDGNPDAWGDGLLEDDFKTKL